MSPPSSTFAITGVGMVSSLGADVAGACAAARAGITRPAEGEFAVQDRSAAAMVPVNGHPVGSLTWGFAELGRWVRLGSLALRNLLQRSPLDAAALSKTAVLVNLPSDFLPRSARELLVQQAQQQGLPPPPEAPVPYAALQPWYRAEYVRKLLMAADLEARPAVQEIIFGDGVGAVTALGKAMELLHSGRVNRCLVGGVDSLLEPLWLESANALRILKTATHAVGFMPGEGAAFLLLEQAERAHREQRPILATLGGLAFQQGTAHRFSSPPPHGGTLAEVILASLKHTPQPCTGFYCDLNGDAARSLEWGMALMRLQPDHAPGWLVTPAESFGETRAAYGFIAACMATQAFARGYHSSDTLLVWSISDSGARGSFTLTRPLAGGRA